MNRSISTGLRALGCVGPALVLAACSSGDINDRGGDILRLEFAGGPGSAQARLVSDLDGIPLLSWLEPDGDDFVLKYSRIEDGAFDQIHEVVRSDRMFINWADFPSVTPVTDTLWFAHWLKRQPDSYAYDVASRISNDGGASWRDAEQMNEDETAAEHGFVRVYSWNGSVAAFWLDGRDLADWSFENPDALLGTSLRLARYGADGAVSSRTVVDDLVCDCCQPDVAITGSGPLVIYRDRTEDEFRDIVVRRFDGADWSAPLTLGNDRWQIEACPVNGPVAAARGDFVAAVWFTAPDNIGHVRMALSSDGGASFGSAIEVDSDGALGQPSVLLDEDGRVFVSWWRRGESGGTDLMLRLFDEQGNVGAERIVAHETIGQVIDVPQMIDTPDGLLFAWTTFDDDGTVRLASLDF